MRHVQWPPKESAIEMDIKADEKGDWMFVVPGAHISLDAGLFANL